MFLPLKSAATDAYAIPGIPLRITAGAKKKHDGIVETASTGCFPMNNADCRLDVGLSRGHKFDQEKLRGI